MALVKVSLHQKVALAQLDNGVTNAVNRQLISELTALLNRAKEDFSALVLTGNEKFFSIGLELPTVMAFDRPQLSAFFYAFQDMTHKLAKLPIPTVAAITGHAVAGGQIIALCCDMRVARSDKAKLGLNESQLGVPVPYLADLLLKNIVGPQAARRLVYEGSLLEIEKALDLGLIDDICPLESVLKHALEKASQLAEVPAQAFAAIKASQLEDIETQYLSKVKARTEQFLDIWFSPEAQQRLASAIKNF
jgi:enoyl-CoA hydratase/carnithine racemase